MSVTAGVAVIAPIFAFGAALGFLLFLLAIAVVTALPAAGLLVLLSLAGVATALLATVFLALVLLALVLLALILLTGIHVLLLLAAILLDSTGMSAALLPLLGLPAALLTGAALLWLTIVLFICHDHSPWLDRGETHANSALFLRSRAENTQFSGIITWIMNLTAAAHLLARKWRRARYPERKRRRTVLSP